MAEKHKKMGLSVLFYYSCLFPFISASNREYVLYGIITYDTQACSADYIGH